jgi:hypothetical protein
MAAQRWSRGALATAAVVVVVALLVAGCGGSNTSPSAADGGGAAGADAGVSLTHVDGTVAVEGDALLVTPKSGAVETYAIGPAVQRGSLQALAAAGTKARVYYTRGADPIAARVDPAPKPEAGAQAFDGQVAKVSKTSIPIQGSDGARRTFTIRDQDASAFDVEHLEGHRDEGEPVRVYYRREGGNDYAVSYEDA